MAIKAHELRIGNLVFDHLDRVQIVAETRADAYICYLSNGAKLKYKLNTTNPIPLTEEWLLKFGFENNNFNKECFYKKYNQQGSFFIFSNKTPVAIANKITNPFYYMFGGLAHSLKYVHQLQNLYFVLCGEELKLN